MPSQQEIEIILSRHWASHLTTPIFIVDTEGDLVYFNESAEPILGRRFAETGRMPAEEWAEIFSIRDEDDVLLQKHELPLTIALERRVPVHRRLWLVGLDNIWRHIQTVCFPLNGQANRFLGAMAIFWELED